MSEDAFTVAGLAVVFTNHATYRMAETHLVAYIIVFWDFQRNIFEVIMYANFFFTIKIELSKSKLKSTMI